jgi:phosphoribosylformylglycinamidine synthase
MLAKVYVNLKKGVLDPQAKAIHKALENLGIQGITDVRQGKVIALKIDTTDALKAKEIAEHAAKQLLANAVMEDFTVIVEKSA